MGVPVRPVLRPSHGAIPPVTGDAGRLELPTLLRLGDADRARFHLRGVRRQFLRPHQSAVKVEAEQPEIPEVDVDAFAVRYRGGRAVAV